MKKKIIIAAVAVMAVVASLCVSFVFYYNGLLNQAHGYVEPKENQIKVACVGDSVTYGMTMKNWRKNAYPFQLREMLGDGYCVENFGFSGRTVSQKGDRPYIKEKLYKKSIEFQPDIVILQIGSNDSKPFNWKGRDEFISYYKELLDSYINLSSEPKIYICTPPPAFPYKKDKVKFFIKPDTISDEITPAVREIADEYNIELIDLFEMFDSKPELFNDGLHPNDEGAKLMTEKVNELILTIR